MKKILLLAVMLTLINPAFARTDGGGKNAYGIPYKATQKGNNPSGGENCYYCWKDYSTQYTPSRHKYAKKS